VKYAKFVMGFLFCVLFSDTASAQCYFVYSSNYAVYTSDSTDGNQIFISVLTDGSASMTIGGSYCGPGYQIMQDQINSATHTPSSYNVIGGTGGWGTGSPSCVNCYLSYQNDQSIAATPGVTYSGQETGQIYCSVGGAIFAPPIKYFNFEIAYTRFITSNYIPDPGPPPVRFYNISPYCTGPTTPPDWNGAGPPKSYWVTNDPPLIPTDVVDGKTICARIGTSGPWTCLPVGKFTGGSWNLPWPLGNCTYNP
jgi:hypothetical protein